MTETSPPYGDPRDMTRQQLRVFLNESWGCLCGAPDEAARALLKLLRLHPLHSNRDAFEAWIPDSGIQYLLLYTLDVQGLTEHGGSVGGGWLTPRGEAVRDALAREEADGFETLMENHCTAGNAVDSPGHDQDAAEPCACRQ